jgi:glycyl-tRNA synthetase beta chain
VGMLERERLVTSGAVSKSFATPRRLTVWVDGVAARQEDVTEDLVGPATKIAYKDGVAMAAAVAFAKKAGVTVEELKTVTNAKGEYLVASSVKAGRGAAEVIAAELPKELAGIYWAKNMYWRAGKPERFVRPVRWMVAMLGSEVVPVEFGGYVADKVTYGHRVLFGDEAIAVKGPRLLTEYEEALRKGFVVADVEVRRQRIRKALDHVTRTVPGLRWREDQELVDKLTHLTEWPSVLLGGFEKEYLALPEEVLVTVMRDHQSYFAVEDKDGKLAPHFLAVLNTEADEAGLAVIRHGNERVLRARFNDARFFWEFDQRVPLAERVKLLENVTFQKDLGSYAKKMHGVLMLLRTLCDALQGKVAIDQDALETATELAKTDLTTELVKEFTELQGVVGGCYAEAQGLGELVSRIIYDQYKPQNMADSVPRTYEGAIFSLADRLDTIASMFSIGIEPTGSKDPFALRRSANGVIKILAEIDIPISFTFILTMSGLLSGQFDKQERFSQFMFERLEFYLKDVCAYSYDVVKAVLAAKASDIRVPANDPLGAAIATSEAEINVRDVVARAEALTQVRGSDDFAAVCASFKRMKNILAQAKQKNESAAREVRTGNFQDQAERNLESKAGLLKDEVETLRRQRNYVSALEQIATLRPQVDAFFEAVMVMAPDEAVRRNRLALLEKVLGDFSGIADFSEIVVAG